MRILLDQSAPKGIARFLPEHSVETCADRGWQTLTNGELLRAAEAAGFEVFLTADKNLRYQQNLAGRLIAIVVLGTPQWPLLQAHIAQVVEAIEGSKPGSYTTVDIPREGTEANAAWKKFGAGPGYCWMW